MPTRGPATRSFVCHERDIFITIIATSEGWRQCTAANLSTSTACPLDATKAAYGPFTTVICQRQRHKFVLRFFVWPPLQRLLCSGGFLPHSTRVHVAATANKLMEHESRASLAARLMHWMESQYGDGLSAAEWATARLVRTKKMKTAQQRRTMQLLRLWWRTLAVAIIWCVGYFRRCSSMGVCVSQSFARLIYFESWKCEWAIYHAAVCVVMDAET